MITGRASFSPDTIPADEPVFIIRARDACAQVAMAYYAELAYRAGASRELIDSVEQHALAMRHYACRNGGTKVPDLHAEPA